jgi:hypothetical protein
VEKQAGCGWRISPDIVMERLDLRRATKNDDTFPRLRGDDNR